MIGKAKPLNLRASQKIVFGNRSQHSDIGRGDRHPRPQSVSGNFGESQKKAPSGVQDMSETLGDSDPVRSG